jgi:hypothetical protein
MHLDVQPGSRVILEQLRFGNAAAEGIDRRIERFPGPGEIKIPPKSWR